MQGEAGAGRKQRVHQAARLKFSPAALGQHRLHQAVGLAAEESERVRARGLVR